MKAIDGTVQGEAIPYEVPDMEAEISVDFLDKLKLEAIEAGIRKAQGASDLLAIIEGVGILKIEREGLWRQAGYATLHAYQGDQPARLEMSKQTISNRRKIADAWLSNRKLLSRLDLSGQVTKLIYFDAAAKLHKDKKLVLEHFKTDSFREFATFSRPKKKKAKALPDVDFAVKKDMILLDGDPLLQFGENLADAEREFISSTLRSAYRARAGECLALVVPVYDEGEARAIDRFLKKLRAAN